MMALLVLVLGAGFSTVFSGPNPKVGFPELAVRKSQLTTVAVVADFAEFEVDGGEADEVYVDDCRRLAERFTETLVAAMQKKGYPVAPRPTLGVGIAADRAKKVKVRSSWDRRDQERKPFSVAAAPFYADSVLVPTPERRADWHAVLKSVFELKLARPGKSERPPIAEAAALREVLGADYALVAVGLGTHKPRYGPGGFGGGGGGVPEPSPYPGCTLRIALLDCRDGTVLWADESDAWQGFSEKRVASFARDLADPMP